MATNIYAVCNQKGGIGKTVTAVNMGIGLARKGKCVRLVDVDAQWAISICRPNKGGLGMKSSTAKIQMTSYEELFQTGDNADPSAEKVLEIPSSDLYPFKNHPFKVLDDEATQDTVESIKAHGGRVFIIYTISDVMETLCCAE